MPERSKKVIVVMPAYNAEKTLERTLDDIPREWVDDIILTDDASRDGTVPLARRLGLRVFVHEQNRGYGANQKTCYREALKIGGDIMVMVHPDHQYDPKVIPQLIQPLLDGECDAVFGSRMLGGRPLEGGMPKWKYLANIFLTALENAAFYMYLTEYHSGLRAYSRRYLETVSFRAQLRRFRLRFRDHRPGRRPQPPHQGSADRNALFRGGFQDRVFAERRLRLVDRQDARQVQAPQKGIIRSAQFG